MCIIYIHIACIRIRALQHIILLFYFTSNLYFLKVICKSLFILYIFYTLTLFIILYLYILHTRTCIHTDLLIYLKVAFNEHNFKLFGNKTRFVITIITNHLNCQYNCFSTPTLVMNTTLFY